MPPRVLASGPKPCGGNNYIFSFTQDSVAKKLRKDLNFIRDMGKIYTAMENQLQELNVKRQAYHSNNFVGNHVNTCLKVYHFIIWELVFV